MSWHLAIGIVGYAVAVNVLAYAAMALDKARAADRSQRIAESTLLTLALVGGSIGMVTAQRTLRHKTRKHPFRSRVAAILLLQALLLAALAAALIAG